MGRKWEGGPQSLVGLGLSGCLAPKNNVQCEQYRTGQGLNAFVPPSEVHKYFPRPAGGEKN
jgi:hypothetical protein